MLGIYHPFDGKQGETGAGVRLLAFRQQIIQSGLDVTNHKAGRSRIQAGCSS
jgi:hypothetical protein